jgi:hypothetical protein
MTHDAAEALIRGVAPAAAPDLAPLAAAIAEFRAASFATPPRPSAELMARLQLAGASRSSVAGVPTRDAAATAPQVTTTSRSRSLGGVRRALGWFAGLGIVAKILIGASVAAAAGATGIGAAAGVGEIVTAVTSISEAPAPAEPDLPVTEPGGGAVSPDGETPVEDVPAIVATEEPTDEPTVAVPTESPAPLETTPADAEPEDSGNNGNGNPGNNGNNGNGHNGNGNNGSGDGTPGKGNPGNNGNGGSKNK